MLGAWHCQPKHMTHVTGAGLFIMQGELHPSAFILPLQKAKREDRRQTGTSSKAQSAVGAVSVP